jgi:hypothetical protein
VNNKIWQRSQDPVTLETPFNRRSFGRREQNILDVSQIFCTLLITVNFC